MRRLMLIVGAIVVVDTMFFATLTPLLPAYEERYALSKVGGGVLAGAYAFGVLLAGLPSGLAASRLGVKATSVGALCLLAVTTVLFGTADSIVVLDVARLIQGVASACAWTGGLAWLLAAAPPGARGAVIGKALGLAIAGALLGPVLGAVASRLGTGWTFSAVGVVALGIAVAALATPAPAVAERRPLGPLLRALVDRRIAAGLWFIALPGALFGTVSLLGPLRLDELGFGATAIGAVFVLSAALEASLSPVVGGISDRVGRRGPILASLTASAIAAAVLPWPSSPWLLAVLIVLAAGAYGLFWVPAFAILTDRAEELGLDVAWGFALVNLAWAPGQAFGSAAGGALARASSDAVPYLVLAAACAATLVYVRRA